MSNNNLPGQTSRSGERYNVNKIDLATEALKPTGRMTSELFTLQTMGDMMETYRQEILRLRREFKKLRDQESNQELVNLHMRYRMMEIKESIKRSTEGLAALQADYSAQRACLTKQGTGKAKGSNKNEKDVKAPSRPARKAKKD